MPPCTFSGEGLGVTRHSNTLADSHSYAQRYHEMHENRSQRLEGGFLCATIAIKLLTLEKELMIVRMWHGRVPTSKAANYRTFLNARAIPDYQSVAGNSNVFILERQEGDVTHFITMTYWQDREVIQAFAGADIEVAKYYPEDTDFLLEFEPTVVHYEVVGQSLFLP